ncbi:MAG: 30S ribosomal protein S20 [Elusimicrobia bacterium]|nr:30S ribosomal protein S20 [Elusimicrobiota bacterium]
MPAKKKTMRHRSGIKAHRQSLRRHARNVDMKKTIRRAARAAGDAATAKDSKTSELLAKASSAFDRAAQRGVIHWKTAARRKSRLAKRVAAGLAATAAPAKA